MASSDVYITVGLDKHGNVQEVRVNGRPIEPKESRPGLLGPGGGAPGCEEIVTRLGTRAADVSTEGEQAGHSSGNRNLTQSLTPTRDRPLLLSRPSHRSNLVLVLRAV